MLKRLVEESDWKISWKKLKKYTKIENWKVEWIYWEEDLDLRWTRITRLWKLKRVWWCLNLYWVVILKDLWELEEVWKGLNLSWTRIASLWKLKRVWWYLWLNWVGTLEDLWELEEVWWDLDLRWTSIEVQKAAIRKIKGWELKVWEEIWLWWKLTQKEYYSLLKELLIFSDDILSKISLDLNWATITSLWRLKRVWWYLLLEWVETLKDLWELEEVWKGLDLRRTRITSLWKLKRVWWYLLLEWVETLKDLWELKEVWRYLDLRWTNLLIQILTYGEDIRGKLKIWDKLLVDDVVVNIVRSRIIPSDLSIINFGKFKEKFWNNIDDINDEKLKNDIKRLLKDFLDYKKQEISRKMIEIIKDKNLSDEKKRKKIQKLNDEYKKYKFEIYNYLGERV
jgi:hypothetical protein